MIKPEKIETIARQVATANLTKAVVSRVMSEETTDSEGKDALRITIVIKPDAVGRLTGDSVLDTLVQIQDRLRRAGEERFPIVQYATDKELLESGD